MDDLDGASRCSLPWGRLKGKSVLITGACGLVCSCVVDLLMYRNMHFGDDITVYALGRDRKVAAKRFFSYMDSRRFVFVQQDVCSEIGVDGHVDYVIHGASNAHPVAFASDPVGTMMSNFYGMDNVLKFAREKGSERVLCISSGEVYGEMDGQELFSEECSGYVNPMDVRSCYPSSKRAAETLCVSYASQYGLDVVVARPSHVYGPTMSGNDSRAIAAFIRIALAGKNVVMKSAGTQVRGYCYVVDAAAAILTIMLLGECCNAYNVSDKDSIVSIRDMAGMVAKCAGRNVVMSEPGELEKSGFTPVKRQVLDSTKLEMLGWRAATHMGRGISKTIRIAKEVL